VEVGRALADPRAASLTGPDRHGDDRRPDIDGAAVVHDGRRRDLGFDHCLPSTS
jgi:hypothetical protein